MTYFPFEKEKQKEKHGILSMLLKDYKNSRKHTNVLVLSNGQIKRKIPR